jgi:molybdenum cofactor cytidylyltransferase
MGHSIAWGVAESADAAGWLVALGDMPFLKPSSIRAVLQHLEQGASIVTPVYDGRRGHPVGFSSRWRQDLLTLTGNQGGVSIIRRYPCSLELVPCTDPGVLRDVDLPSDLGGFDKA